MAWLVTVPFTSVRWTSTSTCGGALPCWASAFSCFGRVGATLGQGQRTRPRDQPGRAVARQIVPGPLQQDQKPVLKADQVDNVHEQPREPGQIAGKADPTQIGHCGGPADGRQFALVPVT